METVKVNLMEWIKKRGMNVECFALLTKIDKSYVYKFIRGDKIPSDRLMKKIKKITMGEISKPEDLITCQKESC